MTLEDELNIPTLDELVELDSTDQLSGLFGDAPEQVEPPGNQAGRLPARDRSRLKREIVAVLTKDLDHTIAKQSDYVLQAIRPQLEETIRKRILAELGQALHEQFPELSRSDAED